MIEVHKTKAKGKFLYINLHGFSDEVQQDLIFKKIQKLIKDHETKLRVY